MYAYVALSEQWNMIFPWDQGLSNFIFFFLEIQSESAMANANHNCKPKPNPNPNFIGLKFHQ